MAKIANNNCRKIYITDDNPRKENPQKIRYELLDIYLEIKFLKQAIGH